ncbi:hypothetical protein NDU88_005624 [Pleurodeles waltl]|uniref:Uncharacterized protein n=1 Tax=Pleurodeles waltl TaxID=8319 RepID=A0AAV7VNF3_PLEWA|nr:hypothetical protein NDU88_005624 [Pleurodeles waltl]
MLQDCPVSTSTAPPKLRPSRADLNPKQDQGPKPKESPRLRKRSAGNRVPPVKCGKRRLPKQQPTDVSPHITIRGGPQTSNQPQELGKKIRCGGLVKALPHPVQPRPGSRPSTDPKQV